MRSRSVIVAIEIVQSHRWIQLETLPVDRLAGLRAGFVHFETKRDPLTVFHCGIPRGKPHVEIVQCVLAASPASQRIDEWLGPRGEA